MPGVVGIDHLVLSVGDFARSKEFYRRLLGFLGFKLKHEYADMAGWSNGKTLFWIAAADAQGRKRKYRKGDILMKKGDVANEMLLTVTGRFLVVEINVELPPGRLMGELGFLTPDNRRTATIECIEDGQVLTITYEKLLEIYFQNPQFGYYFLVLTSQRLLENLARAEAIIAQNKLVAPTTG